MDLDASVILERLSRTDARIICCGHTHVPEVRDFGWKLIVNGGSAGYVFDGDPTASWALVTLDGETASAEIRRTEFDALAVVERDLRPRPARRRLSGGDGPHREAGPMSRAPPARRASS